MVDAKDYAALQDIEALTSGIDHAQPKKERVFQYGAPTSLEALTNQSLWGGRFSDHTFGVWYGATDEATSTAETLHHWLKRVEPDRANTLDPIIVDRQMFRVQLSSKRALDFCPIKSENPWLVADDYARCQETGRWLVKCDAGFLLTPSARKADGICVPTFTPAAIGQEKAIYFLKFSLTPRANQPVVSRTFDEL